MANKKHLFFICPTDCLETIINETFQSDNYFLTSLGNTMTFEQGLLDQVIALIETKDINEISFILSDDNRIIQDAFRNREFSKINGLSELYHKIANQRLHSRLLCHTDTFNHLILSNHLNKKIQELRPKLSNWLADRIILNTKIYEPQNRLFKDNRKDDLRYLDFNLN